MKFTINRNTWRRGGDEGVGHSRGVGPTLLLNCDGWMCCLGQVCSQMGLDDSMILDRTCPASAHPEGYTAILGVLVEAKPISRVEETPLTEAAMRINDNPEIDDETRQKELIELFASYGHEVEFVDGEGAKPRSRPL